MWLVFIKIEFLVISMCMISALLPTSGIMDGARDNWTCINHQGNLRDCICHRPFDNSLIKNPDFQVCQFVVANIHHTVNKRTKTSHDQQNCNVSPTSSSYETTTEVYPKKSPLEYRQKIEQTGVPLDQKGKEVTWESTRFTKS